MNMNCVDHFDQLKSLYGIHRKSKKWWHRIFSFFLDAAVINAFILHKQFTDTLMKLKDFRHEVIAGFVAVTWARVQNKRSSSSISPVQIKNKKPNVPQDVRKTSADHLPERRGCRRCAVCSTKRKPVRTEWSCTVCQVALCMGENKDCFQRFHK